MSDPTPAQIEAIRQRQEQWTDADLHPTAWLGEAVIERCRQAHRDRGLLLAAYEAQQRTRAEATARMGDHSGQQIEAIRQRAASALTNRGGWPAARSQIEDDRDALLAAYEAQQQELNNVRIQQARDHLSSQRSNDTSNRGLGSCTSAENANAGHEQNCPALSLDGDDRAVVDEAKCRCRKRTIEAQQQEIETLTRERDELAKRNARQALTIDQKREAWFSEKTRAEQAEAALATARKERDDWQARSYHFEAVAANSGRTDAALAPLREQLQQTIVLTKADIDQLVEGIEHFIIGQVEDEELRAIWQPYIDKLQALQASVCPHCELPAVLPAVCTPEIHAAIERRAISD